MRYQQQNLLSEAKQIVDNYYDDVQNKFRFEINSDIGPIQRRDEIKSVLLKVFSLIDCQTLQEIKLLNIQIEDRLIDVLSEFQFFKLKSLDLWKNNIGEEGVKKLVEKEWPALKSIRLDQNNIGDRGLSIILTSKLHQKLQQLRIARNGITSNGLRGFISANLSNLKMLHLEKNGLGQKGIQYLAKSQFPQLIKLDLWNSELTSQAMKHLCKAKWPNFKHLQICSNDFLTSQCLEHLEGTYWRLEKLRTSFGARMCIHYLSCIVRPSIHEGQLKIQINLNRDEMVQGMITFVNANVTLTRTMPY